MLQENPLNLSMTFMKVSSKIIATALVAGICFWGCKKTSSGGKPVLKFKSASTYEVKLGGLLSVTLECENVADLKTAESDTALAVQFIVINKASCVSGSGSKSRIFRTGLPATGTFSGTSEVVLNWINNVGTGAPAGYGPLPNTNCRPVDSTYIRFWVKSKTGVVSDTIITDKPIAIYH